ncbi:hypothetical protein OCK02_16795 [Rhizobium sp. TRM96647]|uniref:hypothetical protein n=1 Tax=unclassified Rhizobium TaxID=2613769 RepID=UPI0021E7F2B4|nr:MULTISPECIES: hypothetical protein [unclassified Rhizobium]MCV3737865.1 hypothetical protein [Rhizobium sp. TRM96647]MCV3759405.1 hypothetical protein [Rhizobium sp. TRM96650]
MHVSASLLLSFVSALAAAAPAAADENAFLRSLSGDWTGNGTVIMRIGRPAVSVDCRLRSDAGAASISMKGNCSALAFFRRAISAKLNARGARYSGIYIGPSGQPSALSGRRKGGTINLAVRWNRVVNGDRKAEMTIQKLGDNGLRLRTVDHNPSNGKTVVTSDIRLVRN